MLIIKLKTNLFHVQDITNTFAALILTNIDIFPTKDKESGWIEKRKKKG